MMLRTMCVLPVKEGEGRGDFYAAICVAVLCNVSKTGIL
jgi:hypothetical protein